MSRLHPGGRNDNGRPTCAVESCGAPATRRAVLLCRPAEYPPSWKPMRVPLALLVCDAHANETIDAILDDDLWAQVLAGAPAGARPPVREATTLDYEPLRPPRCGPEALP